MAQTVTGHALATLRELCGGHGLHSHNEIITARIDGDVNTTFGGDNTILCNEAMRVATTTPPMPPPPLTEHGITSSNHAAHLFDTLAHRLHYRWQTTHDNTLCRPYVHATCTAHLLRHWTTHTHTNDPLLMLHATTSLCTATEHLVATSLLDTTGIHHLHNQHRTLSTRCATNHAETLTTLDVPPDLLTTPPIAHPNYIHRIVTTAPDTTKLRNG